MRKIYLLIYKIFFKNFINSDTIILGKIFKFCRGSMFNLYTGNKSQNINIQKGASFAIDTKLGNNSGLGENCLISKGVKIGDNVMMGPDVKIYTVNHNFKDINTPMNTQGFQNIRNVIINDDVWIGANVIILPGVTIGKGSVLGAGCVVAKDVESYSIMVGNPAKKVKSRLDNEL